MQSRKIDLHARSRSRSDLEVRSGRKSPASLDILKMCQLLEFSVALLDLGKSQLLEPIQAEFFYIERRHHRSENNRLPDRSLRQVLRRGQITDKAAGETVAGAGGIENIFQGK